MKFSVVALLLAYPAAVSAIFPASIEVSMLDIDEVEAHHRIVVDGSDLLLRGTYPSAPDKGGRGESLIHSNLIQRIYSKNAEDPAFLNPAPKLDEWHPVFNTFLHGTSNYHIDHKLISGSKVGCCGCERVVVDDMVAFVALNTNEDAYFDHPSMSVPITKGSMIKFNGSDPHRTVVNKGHVHLLGPFEMKEFRKVTALCTDCCCLDDGTCTDSLSLSTCPDGTITGGSGSCIDTGGAPAPQNCFVPTDAPTDAPSPSTKSPKSSKSKAPSSKAPCGSGRRLRQESC